MVNGQQRWVMLAVIGAAVCLAMTPWFSATAVVPELVRTFRLDSAQASWLTMAVQGGFVIGTLVSALLTLADTMSARWVFAAGCVGAAVANLLTASASTSRELVAWRFATGASLALVYPPGIKLVAGWFPHGRAVAVGILIACLTLGKAVPYLLAASFQTPWHGVIHAAAGCALAAAALIILVVRDGPHVAASAPFRPGAVFDVFARRAARLGVVGYLGHMWELYAMWAWVAAYVTASELASGASGPESSVRRGACAAAVAIGAGAVGCVMAGWLADRHGRARIAAWSLMISGSCCALTVPAFGSPFPLVLALAAIWGAAVVADSAQFSVIVANASPPEYVGTALTIQTCLGFLLTMLAIWLVPEVAAWIGWQWAFVVVLPGPVLGVQAMLALVTPRRITPE